MALVWVAYTPAASDDTSLNPSGLNSEGWVSEVGDSEPPLGVCRGWGGWGGGGGGGGGGSYSSGNSPV